MEADLKAKQEEELKAKETETKALQEAADLKAKQEEELKAKETETKALQEAADLKTKQEEELKAQAEADLKAEAEAKEEEDDIYYSDPEETLEPSALEKKLILKQAAHQRLHAAQKGADCEAGVDEVVLHRDNDVAQAEATTLIVAKENVDAVKACTEAKTSQIMETKAKELLEANAPNNVTEAKDKPTLSLLEQKLLAKKAALDRFCANP